MNINPQLIDPENHDYRLVNSSPAQGYGCQTYLSNVQNSKKVSVLNYKNKTGSKILVSGVINENTFWQADTIMVTDTLTVANNVTLKIQPGVRVEFAGYFPLRVQGRIIAEGRADSLIVFTAHDPTGYTADSSITGSWHGIRFAKTSSQNDFSLLKYCRLEYGKAVTGTAFSDLCGGVLYLEDFSKLRVENCFIENNTAFYGGAFYFFYNSNPEVTSCLINDNHGLEVGAAIVNYYSFPRIINNTITGNEILNTSPDILNGAVFNFLAKPQFYNNIIWNNQTFTHSQIRHHKYYYTRNNDITGDSLIYYNIDADPLFNSVSGNDFSLTENSPCIDAGSQIVPYFNFSLSDLAGNVRLSGNRPDMGAYEFQQTSINNTTANAGSFQLSCYPNPFNPTTHILFSIDKPEILKIAIFNIRGELVSQLAHNEFAAGQHLLTWNGVQQSSGLYILSLSGKQQSRFLKLILSK